MWKVLVREGAERRIETDEQGLHSRRCGAAALFTTALTGDGSCTYHAVQVGPTQKEQTP
jgi:hypothetical protein